MSKLNLAAIKKLTSNTITAAALRDAGISWVPVMPDGSLADLALAAFIQAGQPEGDGFFTHNGDDIKLFAPEEWERNRHTKAGPAKYDPINGEQLTEVTLAAYNALAPIKLLGDSSVPAIELLAYGAEKHLLPVDLTSREARRLPRGVEPIAPDDDLKPAAREWPYDKNAAEFARRRLERGIPTPVPVGRRLRDGSPAQTVVNNGAVGVQINHLNSVGQGQRMVDLPVKMFSASDCARVIGSSSLAGLLTICANPDMVSAIAFYSDLVRAVQHNGMEIEFRQILRGARSRWTNEIDNAVL